MIRSSEILCAGFILILGIILFEYSPIDMWLQNFLYDFESATWLWDRDEKISKFLFYDGIKILIVVFFLVMLISAVCFRTSLCVQNHREGLAIVILSILLIPLLVGSLKAITNMPCPKNLKHYGGSYPTVSLLKPYPENFHQTKQIKCYPAGHASGGFALLSLVFLFKKKKHKVLAVSVALSVGWVMGAYKMIIGDHFLGHTMVTMLLSWFITLLIAKTVTTYSKNRNARNISEDLNANVYWEPNSVDTDG